MNPLLQAMMAADQDDDAPAMPLPEATADTPLEAFARYRNGEHLFAPGDLVTYRPEFDPRQHLYRGQPELFGGAVEPGRDGWPPVQPVSPGNVLRYDCALLWRNAVGGISWSYADSRMLMPWSPPSPDTGT